ncbi:MAG: hypothetical protein RBU45_03185 [Myxococcota bacterium]|jgi:hypothetical protein|nr:hypothetical protein [Myxococcota bacterium]
MTDQERTRTGTLKVKDLPRPSPDSQIQLDEGGVPADVAIILTQAFCPAGHALIREDHPRFDDQPGLRLRVCWGEASVLVTLSPYHGDARKVIEQGTPPGPGQLVRICCPECGAEFPSFGPCVAEDGGTLRTIFLSRRRDEGCAVMVCDVWDCPRSRIVDEWSILSEVVLHETGG